MAFSSAEAARLKKITKQTQLTDKPNYFNYLESIAVEEKGATRGKTTPNDRPLARCASAGGHSMLCPKFAMVHVASKYTCPNL